MEVTQGPPPAVGLLGHWRAYCAAYRCSLDNIRNGFPFYSRGWHPVRSRWDVAWHGVYPYLLAPYFPAYAYQVSRSLLRLLGYVPSTTYGEGQYEEWEHPGTHAKVIRKNGLPMGYSRTHFQHPSYRGQMMHTTLGLLHAHFNALRHGH